MEKQLQQFYKKDENKIKAETEEFLFEFGKWSQINNKQFQKIYQVNNLESAYHHKYILIKAIFHQRKVIMSTDFQIQNKNFNRNRKSRGDIMHFHQVRSNNLYLYTINDTSYIRYQQIYWGNTENFNCRNPYFETLEKELVNSIDFKFLNDFQIGKQKLNKNEEWFKHVLRKMQFQNPQILISFKTFVSQNKQFQFLQLISVLEDKNNQIMFQQRFDNNLYKKQYEKKINIELKQNQIDSLFKLLEQINAYLRFLSNKQQKLMENSFIRIAFEVGKNRCFQFDKDGQDLFKIIQNKETINLTLEQSKNLIESISIFYFLKEKQIMKEEYFNKSVFQVDKDGKLKINLLNSNELNASNKELQNLKSTPIEEVIQIITYIVEIQLQKQLSEKEEEILQKFIQIIQYHKQTGLQQISQILYTFQQI